jgi:hypothetical protein
MATPTTARRSKRHSTRWHRPGGALVVPPGRYALATPVRRDFLNQASSITIKGVGSSSQFLVRSGDGTQNLRLENLERLVLKGLVFAGTPGVRDDATAALFLSHCLQATIEQCDFYGISSISTAGGAVIYANHTDLRIQSSSFRGCAGNAVNGNSVIYSDSWIGLDVSNTDFIDYGMLNGIEHSKTPIALTYAWVLVGAPNKLNNAMGQGSVQLRGVRMDEGAWIGFACHPGNEGSRVAQIHLSGLRINVSSAELAAGIFIYRADHVTIERSWLGYNSHSRSAISLVDAGNVTLHSVYSAKGMNGKLSLNADSLTRLTVIDSSFDSLYAAPEMTTIVSNWNEGLGLAGPLASVDASTGTASVPQPKTPNNSNDPSGSVGDIRWDDTFIYVKTPKGWKRTALGSW